MPEAVYQMMTMLSTLVAPLPIGTNLGVLHLLWMLVSGRLLGSRGAILPGLSDLGLTDGEVRRAWAALGGAWTSDALLADWRRQVEAAGHWQPPVYGGYRPVAIDLTGFWRPRLRSCPTRHYHAEAGTARPAIVLGLIARVGSAAGQRLGLVLGLVRADPTDPSPAAHRRRLIAVAAARRQPEDVLVGDREFRVADFQAADVPAWLARLPKTFTARRATPPPYRGRGRPPTRGLVVRPLPRRRKDRVVATTPPDQVTTWTEDDRVVRAEVWTDLVRPDAAPGSPPFTVVAIHHPRYREPLLLATPLAVTPQQVRALYRDRWPVEAVQRIPLTVRWPGVTPADRACDDLVANIDLPPTLCDLLGLPAPAGWDGRSFAAQLRGQAGAPRPYLVWSHGLYTCQRAVRTPRWALLHTSHPGLFPFEPVALFDMATDPHQTTNLAEEHPQVVAELDHLLTQWLHEQLGRPGAGVDPLQLVVETGPWKYVPLDFWLARLARRGRDDDIAAIRRRVGLA